MYKKIVNENHNLLLGNKLPMTNFLSLRNCKFAVRFTYLYAL